jgi:hypothetical protein
MTTQLSLYNDALIHMGERPLVALTDNTEPRRVLDQIWTNARKFCLEQGHWKFAQRTAKLDYSLIITPAFGYPRAFTKPADFVRLSQMCVDEFLDFPLTDYKDEAGVWYANLDNIYVQYVSSDAAYGYDLTLWPETFTFYVGLYLAWRAGTRISVTVDRDALQNDLREAKLNALSKDAVSGPTQFLPSGGWAATRSGGGGQGRKNPSNLYG